MKKLIFAAIILITLAIALPVQAAECENENMKGVWISSVYNLDFPTKPTTDSQKLMKEIDEDVNKCCDMGFNTIFLQVVPCSDALYKSDILPWSSYLTGTQGTAPDNNFDPLSYWIEKCHENSIELHAWINPYRITKDSLSYSKLSSNHPAKLNPSLAVKYSDGNYYYNPGLPDVDKLITDVVEEIVTKYDVDGIHIDDYFYPGSNFNDYETYKKYNNNEFSNISDWRRANVNSLVEQIYNKVHSLKNDVVFGVSPFGIWRNKSSDALGSCTSGSESYSKMYADSLTWIKEGYIDYIAPQIYWEFGNKAADYKTLTDWWNNAVSGTKVKLYIGLADYRCSEAKASSCWYNGKEILKQMSYNQNSENVSGEIHFRFKLIDEQNSLKTAISQQYHPDITVILNNKELSFPDQKPIILNSRTLVPMRAIFEAFGYNVEWIDESREVYAYKDTEYVKMKIGSNSFTSNDKTFSSDVAPVIIGDRTMIPLRALSEALNKNVQWNIYRRTVTIQ